MTCITYQTVADQPMNCQWPESSMPFLSIATNINLPTRHFRPFGYQASSVVGPTVLKLYQMIANFDWVAVHHKLLSSDAQLTSQQPTLTSMLNMQ